MAITFYPTALNQVTAQVAAKSLRELMNTATPGSWDLPAINNINYVILNPEWALRYSVDGSTPTAAIWLMWGTGLSYYIEGNDIMNKLKLINAVKVNFAIGSIT